MGLNGKALHEMGQKDCGTNPESILRRCGGDGKADEGTAKNLRQPILAQPRKDARGRKKECRAEREILSEEGGLARRSDAANPDSP